MTKRNFIKSYMASAVAGSSAMATEKSNNQFEFSKRFELSRAIKNQDDLRRILCWSSALAPLEALVPSEAGLGGQMAVPNLAMRFISVGDDKCEIKTIFLETKNPTEYSGRKEAFTVKITGKVSAIEGWRSDFSGNQKNTGLEIEAFKIKCANEPVGYLRSEFLRSDTRSNVGLLECVSGGDIKYFIWNLTEKDYDFLTQFNRIFDLL